MFINWFVEYAQVDVLGIIPTRHARLYSRRKFKGRIRVVQSRLFAFTETYSLLQKGCSHRRMIRDFTCWPSAQEEVRILLVRYLRLLFTATRLGYSSEYGPEIKKQIREANTYTDCR